MKSIRKTIAEEQGSVVLIIALALLGLLAITGLVIDGGSLYMTKSHLQKAANAAVLSGAQELTTSETAVEGVIDEVLQAHEEQLSLDDLTIESKRKVSVQLNKDVPLAFMKLFGWASSPVEAKATAEIQTMATALGVAPLGIDDSITLEFNKEYTLKVDEHDVENGNFGVLALGRRGADTYEVNLANGYKEAISIGDILETEPGNVVGPTKRGVKARLDACPYPEGETHHRDCPRVILIPVYKPLGDMRGLSEVEVTGFAYFYLSEPMNEGDKTIKGKFIERAGTGIVDPEAANKGAYSIRLIE